MVRGAEKGMIKLNHIQERALYASVRDTLICSYGNQFFISGTGGIEKFQRNTLEYLYKRELLRYRPGMSGRGEYMISSNGVAHLGHTIDTIRCALGEVAMVAWDKMGIELHGRIAIHNFLHWQSYRVDESVHGYISPSVGPVKAETREHDGTWWCEETNSHLKTGLGCVYEQGTKEHYPRRWILISNLANELGVSWREVAVDGYKVQL